MIKIGVIGAGKWGKNHIRTLAKVEECQLVGLADPDSRGKKTARELKIKFFSDYKKMLPFVDAVTIVAPTNIHYAIAKDCLSKNVHALVEKPITLHAKQTRELLLLAQEKNLILKIGYLYRYNNAVLRLKELIHHAGDIQYITGRYVHSSNPPRTDSGAIFNFGVHHFDTISFLLQRRPKGVFCKKLNYLSKTREDAAVVILDYGNFFASMEFSWFHPEKKRDFWIIGSKEKIYADLGRQAVTRFPKEINYEKIVESPEIEEEIHMNDPLFDELRSFCRLVENEKHLIKSKSVRKEKQNIEPDLYLATEICEAALKSACLGREIEL